MDYLKLIRNGSIEEIETLISNGFLVDSNYYDYKALTSAIQYKRLDLAELLLSKNFRVNSNSTVAHETPLHLAVKLADINLITILLLKNASITVVDLEGNSPLHLAFLSRYDKIVELLLHYISMQGDSNLNNVKNAQGLTHLHIACTNDNVKLIEQFLKAGADCNDTVSKDSPYCAGYTAMHFAISHNCFKVARMLLDDGDLQAENSDGLTSFQLAYTTTKSSQIIFYHMLEQSEYHSLYNHLTNFHMACLTNFSDLVDTFIENGAVINSQLNKEATFGSMYTPLHCAVESQCEENVHLLLEAGADWNLKNKYNMTPLHLAFYHEDFRKKNAIVNLLYKYTKNKKQNYKDINQLSYLHIAVTRNDIDLVKKILIKNEEDVNLSVLRNSRNFSGFTPLHFAVGYGYLEISKLLINHGAQVNDSWSDYGSPLHLAFETGRQDLINLLLNNGAVVNISRIKDGKTMLHLLVEYYVNDLEARTTREKDSNRWGPKDGLLRYLGKLVDLGCDVNAKETVNGDTALHLACFKFYYGASCARLLLELGANINLENTLGMTPLECALSKRYQDNGRDYMMLYHHVQQLKALGLQVNSKNEQTCRDILKKRAIWENSTSILEGINVFRNQELELRHQERLDEIKKMQSVKLDTNVSLHGFVLLKPKYAAAYVKNKMLKEILEDDKLKQSYPLYTHLIRLCYWKAVRRFKSKGVAKIKRLSPRSARTQKS